MAPRWEYQHISRVLADQGALGDDELNPLGDDRWELVGMVSDAGVAHYYLKRTTFES